MEIEASLFRVNLILGLSVAGHGDQKKPAP